MNWQHVVDGCEWAGDLDSDLLNWLWVKVVDLFEIADVADAENFDCIVAVAYSEWIVHDEGSDVDVVYMEDDDCYQLNRQVMSVVVYINCNKK